jgi:hypothetical protein
MSTISAGTTSGTALVTSGDTSGTLVLQTNGTTTAVTIATNQVVTLAQPLPVASGGTGGTATPTAGGVVYGTGTAQAVTAAGTSGQVLTSAGASAPTWAAIASSVTLLSTVTASNSTTVDVETTFSSTYDAYLLIVTGMTSQNNNVQIKAQMKLNGSYVSSSTYSYYTDSGSSQYGSSSSYSTGTADITVANGSIGNNAADSADLQIYISNPSSTAFSKLINWTGVEYYTTSTRVTNVLGVGSNSNTGALTGLRFYFSSGNVVAGKFRLYGISNS